MRVFVIHNHPQAIRQFGYCNVHSSYEGISIREKSVASMIIGVDETGYAEIKQNKLMLSKEIPGTVWGPIERMHHKLTPKEFPIKHAEIGSPWESLKEVSPGVFAKATDMSYVFHSGTKNSFSNSFKSVAGESEDEQ